MKNRLFKKLTAAATVFAMIGGAVRVPTGDMSLFGRIFTANAEDNLDTKPFTTEKEPKATYDEERNILTISGNIVRSTIYEYHKIPDLTIIADSETVLPEDCGGLFYWFSAKTIDLSNADASNVKDMAAMFQGCPNLISVDLGNLNTKNVTNMHMMFYDCPSLESIDLSGFDTSNVKNMGWMFSCCFSLKSLDLSSFDTSNVENMDSMFYACNSLESVDVSNFDTSSTNINPHMFRSCTALDSSICILDKIVILFGNTGAEFYLNPCEKLAKVVMSGPNGDKEITDFSSVKQEDGTYKFTYSINASQADRLITLKAYDKDGKRLIVCDQYYGLCDHSQASSTSNNEIMHYKGHSYMIFDKSRTWEEAYEYCNDLCGHLVTISDADEQSFIEQMLIDKSNNQNCYWIGLYYDYGSIEKDTGLPGWYWIDDTEYDYSNWNESEPNNMLDLEYCAHIFGNVCTDGSVKKNIGEWNDASNEGAVYAEDFYSLDNFGFICEWDTIISEKKKDPVILIPGIMGSKLFKDEECTECIWPPSIEVNKVRNNILNDDLYVKDPYINQKFLSKKEREYGAQNCLDDLVDYLCADPINRDIYVFSYDWRKSNDESAEELKKFIDGLNVDKVDIVAHSMGGLVVSRYFKLYENDNKIDKIITCGTPYEGAPHLYEVIELGNITENELINSALKNLFGFSKEIKTSFQGIAELIPSQEYCKTLPMQKSTNNVETQQFNMNEDEYKELVYDLFGNEIAPLTFNFINNIKDSSTYNCLSNYEKSYFVIGNNIDTVESVTYRQYNVPGLEEPLNQLCGITVSNLGDGTVPYHSATMRGHLLSDEYNKRVRVIEATHSDVVKKNHDDPENDPIPWIITILNDGIPDTYDSSMKYIPVKKHSVDVIEMEYIVCSVSGEESFESSFVRPDIIVKDNDIKIICKDKDTNLDITLSGTDTGTMDITVCHFAADEELPDERTFEDVPITNKTIIKTKADNNEVTILSIDKDGDGIVDATWTAKKNETVTAPDATIVTTTTNISNGSSTTTSTTTTITTTKLTTSTITSVTSTTSTTTNKPTTTSTTSTTTTTSSTTTTTTTTKDKTTTTSSTTTTTTTSKDKTTTTKTTTSNDKTTTTSSSDTTTTVTDINETTSTITSPVTQPDYTLGDVNNDGKINAIDASSGLAYYARISTNQEGGYTDEQILAADVTHDGLINAVDASNILAYYAYVSTAKEDIMSIEEYMKRK